MMSKRVMPTPPFAFINARAARVYHLPWGKHEWLSEPALTGAADLALVRVTMPPGTGHQFHRHPELEELIYVVGGIAEQWVDRSKRRLRAGDVAFVPRDVVHATYNPARRPLTFLAILSPAASKGPAVIDCFNEEPWRRLRTPIAYRPVNPKTGRRLKE